MGHIMKITEALETKKSVSFREVLCAHCKNRKKNQEALKRTGEQVSPKSIQTQTLSTRYLSVHLFRDIRHISINVYVMVSDYVQFFPWIFSSDMSTWTCFPLCKPGAPAWRAGTQALVSANDLSCHPVIPFSSCYLHRASLPPLKCLVPGPLGAARCLQGLVSVDLSGRCGSVFISSSQRVSCVPDSGLCIFIIKWVLIRAANIYLSISQEDTHLLFISCVCHFLVLSMNFICSMTDCISFLIKHLFTYVAHFAFGALMYFSH